MENLVAYVLEVSHEVFVCFNLIYWVKYTSYTGPELKTTFYRYIKSGVNSANQREIKCQINVLSGCTYSPKKRFKADVKLSDTVITPLNSCLSHERFWRKKGDCAVSVGVQNYFMFHLMRPSKGFCWQTTWPQNKAVIFFQNIDIRQVLTEKWVTFCDATITWRCDSDIFSNEAGDKIAEN